MLPVSWRTPLQLFFKTSLNFSQHLIKMCSCSITGRALHYVFKIPDRRKSIQFYKDVLGMKVLRHEEFSEGCEAACNGPYDTRWSKTMIGYGPEDDNFVFELTYNYPIKHYEKGNDFIGVTLIDDTILKRAKEQGWPILNENTLEAPGGYRFFIVDKPRPENPVEKVALASTNLDKTKNYWTCTLGMKLFKKNDGSPKSLLVGYDDKQTKLEFIEIKEPINRAEAFGRIAFSCDHDLQPAIEKNIKETNGTILTPLISLDTPGKATVRVIILADPDGHEICFVDDQPFRELSQYCPDDERILNTQMKKEEKILAESAEGKKAAVGDEATT